jgi:hypothetical protein
VRILLDESVPVQVRNAVRDHSVSTVVEMGWRGISNSELLDRAEAEGFELIRRRQESPTSAELGKTPNRNS